MTGRLAAAPCPRCGCHVAKSFECNCGAVHDDYCGNCGRWVSLPSTEHAVLQPPDVRCDAGAVEHEHSDEEKGESIRQMFEALRRRQAHRGAS